jgi:cytochrome d ubiquinol oxidase subunit I
LIAFGITTLFVIKSVFLGVMFFGQRRVSARAHVFSVCMVALGLTCALFWEVVLQSWTHTPTGAVLIDGLYQVEQWFQVILNPSLLWYALLFVAGGFLTVGCLLLAVAAWQAGRRPLEDHERMTYRVGIVVTLLAASLQLVALDGSVRRLAREQPITAAAVMGIWQTGTQPDLIWFGWPSADDQSSPGLIVTASGARRWLGKQGYQKWVGLDQAEGELPAVKTLFLLLRLACYGTLFVLGLMLVTLWLRHRRGPDPAKYPAWLLRAQVWSGMVGAGVWLCVFNLGEVGRSPYMVWDVLRQEDLLTSAGIPPLATGLIASSLLYAILFAGFIRMFFHAARYGVVPVRKPGVRR